MTVAQGGLALAVMGGFLAAAAIIAAYTLYTAHPPLPPSPGSRRAFLANLPDPANLPPGPVLELGAGWGGLALALARRYPARAVLAYEISPLPWLVAWLRTRLGGPSNLTLYRADFRRVVLPEAALVTCYLGPYAMRLLGKRLASGLPQGAVIASIAFALPGWVPVAGPRARDLYGTPIYIYRIGQSRRVIDPPQATKAEIASADSPR